MGTKKHRQYIPLSVKLHACLLLLGFTEDEIKSGVEWDHNPALCLRTILSTGAMVPDPNDPHFIRPIRKAEHKIKTFGLGGTRRVSRRGSDISEPARLDRIAKKHAEFRAKILKPNKSRAALKKRARSKWPKGKSAFSRRVK